MVDTVGQILLVLVHGIDAVARQIPAPAVHDDDIGLFRHLANVFADGLEIVRVAARDEVELDEVIGRLVLSHLRVCNVRELLSTVCDI